MIGMVVGGVTAFFFVQSKIRGVRTELALAAQKAEQLEHTAAQLRAETDAARAGTEEMNGRLTQALLEAERSAAELKAEKEHNSKEMQMRQEQFAQQLKTVEGFIDHVSENRGVPAYHGIEVELAGPKADLLAAIREVGALMQTAGVKNTQVNEWVYRSLAALKSSDEKAAEQLAESHAIKAELL